MVKFGGEIGTLYQMLKNAFKKHPLQNRTNVQIKGGGQRPFEQCSKKLHFFERGASLIKDSNTVLLISFSLWSPSSQIENVIAVFKNRNKSTKGQCSSI